MDYIQREVSKENPAFAKVNLEKIVRLSDLGHRTYGLSKNSSPELEEALRKAFQVLEKKGVIKRLQKRYPYLDVVESTK